MNVDKLLSEAVVREEGIRRVRGAVRNAEALRDAAERHLKALRHIEANADKLPMHLWPDSRDEEIEDQIVHFAAASIMDATLRLMHFVDRAFKEGSGS